MHLLSIKDHMRKLETLPQYKLINDVLEETTMYYPSGKVYMKRNYNKTYEITYYYENGQIFLSGYEKIILLMENGNIMIKKGNQLQRVNTIKYQKLLKQFLVKI